MVTFESKVTKSGNLKVSSQLREILGLYSGQRVTVHLECAAPDEIKIPQVLKNNDFPAFLDSIRESGNSSYKYLQNVFSINDYKHQGLGIGLNVAENVLGRKGACRVHGGGFAGTIQAFVPMDLLKEFKMDLEKVFGGGTCHVLGIRRIGGCEVDKNSIKVPEE